MKYIFLLCFLAANCFGQAFTFQDPAWVALLSSGYSIPMQAETTAYQAAIAANGGTIATSKLQAVNTFVFNAKAHGYWSYLLDCSPFAGDQTNAAIVKLKVMPGSTRTNLIMHGFKATDWSSTVGWNNTGTNNFNTGVTNQAPYWGTNGLSAWISYPITNQSYGESSYMMGHNNQLGLYYGMGWAGGDLTASMTSLSLAAVKVNSLYQQYIPGMGLYGFTRTATNAITVYQNGLTILSDPTVRVQTGISNAEAFCLFGRNNQSSGTIDSHLTNCPYGWYAMDGGIPTNDLGYYYNDVAQMEAGLGRCSWNSGVNVKCVLIVGQSLACAGSQTSANIGPNWPGETNQSPFVLYSGGCIIPGDRLPYMSSDNSLTGFIEGTGTVDTGWKSFGEHWHWWVTNNGYPSEPIILMHWAHSGQPYTNLAKASTNLLGNTNPSMAVSNNIFSYSLNDLTNLNNTVHNLTGGSLNVCAIVACHGEADLGNSNYEANIEQWVADYNVAIDGITGQTNVAKLYSFQPSISTYPVLGGSYGFLPYSSIQIAQAAIDNYPSNRVIGARYWGVHQTDNLHFSIFQGYDRQGEYAAEAVCNDVYAGRDTALRATNVNRVGATITVQYNQTNLVMDTTLVSQATNYGFNYTNSAGLTNITSVYVTGGLSNQVAIVLGSTPAVAGTLTYAINFLANTNLVAGLTNAISPLGYGFQSVGPHGNLRDNNPDVGFNTTSNLYNWGTIFSLPVN